MNKIIAFVFMGLIISSCAGSEAKYPKRVKGEAQAVYGEHEKAFGGDLNLFGGDEPKQQTGGIGVNAYLWKATLSTVSFMPVTAADPFGGVIITDWQTLKNNKDARYRVNVYILDKQLRADALNVSVFKQIRNEDTGEWEDSTFDDGLKIKLEDAILTKARELKISEVIDEK